MTHQYEEQAAISSDINIYLIRTSRWKNLGSKSHLLCLIFSFEHPIGSLNSFELI